MANWAFRCPATGVLIPSTLSGSRRPTAVQQVNCPECGGTHPLDPQDAQLLSTGATPVSLDDASRPSLIDNELKRRLIIAVVDALASDPDPGFALSCHEIDSSIDFGNAQWQRAARRVLLLTDERRLISLARGVLESSPQEGLALDASAKLAEALTGGGPKTPTEEIVRASLSVAAAIDALSVAVVGIRRAVDAGEGNEALRQDLAVLEIIVAPALDDVASAFERWRSAPTAIEIAEAAAVIRVNRGIIHRVLSRALEPRVHQAIQTAASLLTVVFEVIDKAT